MQTNDDDVSENSHPLSELGTLTLPLVPPPPDGVGASGSMLPPRAVESAKRVAGEQVGATRGFRPHSILLRLRHCFVCSTALKRPQTTTPRTYSGPILTAHSLTPE